MSLPVCARMSDACGFREIYFFSTNLRMMYHPTPMPARLYPTSSLRNGGGWLVGTSTENEDSLQLDILEIGLLPLSLSNNNEIKFGIRVGTSADERKGRYATMRIDDCFV